MLAAELHLKGFRLQRSMLNAITKSAGTCHARYGTTRMQIYLYGGPPHLTEFWPIRWLVRNGYHVKIRSPHHGLVMRPGNNMDIVLWDLEWMRLWILLSDLILGVLLAQAIVDGHNLLSTRDSCWDRTLIKTLPFALDAVNWCLRRHVIYVRKRFKRWRRCRRLAFCTLIGPYERGTQTSSLDRR